MASVGAIESSTYHTKQLNLWPNSSASCVVNYSQLSVVQERWSHLKTTQIFMGVWQASITSHSKSRLGNFQHRYLSELLGNVYSYCLMVKGVPCCSVHERQLFLNPVTYNIWLWRWTRCSCRHKQFQEPGACLIQEIRRKTEITCQYFDL